MARKNKRLVEGDVEWEALADAQSLANGMVLCWLCDDSWTRKQARNMTVDHIVPERDGGADELHNLQLVCHVCNSIKRDNDTRDARLDCLAARQGTRAEWRDGATGRAYRPYRESRSSIRRATDRAYHMEKQSALVARLKAPPRATNQPPLMFTQERTH